MNQTPQAWLTVGSIRSSFKINLYDQQPMLELIWSSSIGVAQFNNLINKLLELGSVISSLEIDNFGKQSFEQPIYNISNAY